MISAAAAILIPLQLFGLGEIVQYHPGFSSILDDFVPKFLLVFCPFVIGLLDQTEGPTIASLSTLLMANVVYYCVAGSFIWLGFRYNRAFWIPVAAVVVPLVVFGLLW